MAGRGRGLALAMLVGTTAACGRSHGLPSEEEAKAAPRDAAPAAASSAEPRPPADAGSRRELPRGGRTVFPRHRLVGFCGTPGAPELGRLTGNLGARARAIEALAREYGGDRVTLPVFELIAVVVQGAPGPDGKHRRRVGDDVVERYLDAARAAKAILLLDIQPGRSDFLTEAKRFERWLREPDVGLALDPEWAMTGKEQPGARFGQASGAEIMTVARWLSALVEAEDLPEKVLVFHQVNDRVLRDEPALGASPGVVLVKSVDGLGPRANKVRTYDHLVKAMPAGVHAGFKLFFDEDTRDHARLMTPPEVLRLVPVPEYVMYE